MSDVTRSTTRRCCVAFARTARSPAIDWIVSSNRRDRRRGIRFRHWPCAARSTSILLRRFAADRSGRGGARAGNRRAPYSARAGGCRPPPGRRTPGPDERPRTGRRRSISIRSGGSDDRDDRRSRDGSSFCDWSRNFRLPLPRPRRPGRRQQPRRSRPRLGRFHRQRQFGMTRRAIPRLREQESFLTLRPPAKAANPRPLFAS